jgi:DNA-binding cell septation regulator SpoVG
MLITEIKISFPAYSNGRLLAFASVCLDNQLVIQNIKLIQSRDGHFITMPSRKEMIPCERCQFKNAFDSKFCSTCGLDLPRFASKFYDICFPINSDFRKYLTSSVFEKFNQEVSKESLTVSNSF